MVLIYCAEPSHPDSFKNNVIYAYLAVFLSMELKGKGGAIYFQESGYEVKGSEYKCLYVDAKQK